MRRRACVGPLCPSAVRIAATCLTEPGQHLAGWERRWMVAVRGELTRDRPRARTAPVFVGG